MENYGYKCTEPLNDGLIPARITEVHKELFRAVCENGEINARLKSSVYFNFGTEEFPTAGDFVALNYNPDGDSLIVKTLPRKSLFSRRNPTPGMGGQAVAANFDYVFILSSLNHDFNPKRNERYVTAAWQSGGIPVIILTKCDLCDDINDKLRAARNATPNVDVFAISSVTGEGIDAIGEYFKAGKTVVFLGSSGVGKSSLVNALAKQEIMTTNGIREQDSKGHHTTTHRQLVRLDSGVMIIDTPGMRELGMWDVSDGLGKTFSEIDELLVRCRFSDCTHTNEPGCAVTAALESGELSEERWESYLKLKREAFISDEKSAFLVQKNARNKAVSMRSKEMKKARKIRY